MKRPVQRLLVALVALVCLTVGSAVPASAGTLTSPTFTAAAGWTTTGASGSRYDWGFTTTTTSTLSKVTASVPAGTGGKDRYLALPGITSNVTSTPDSVTNSVTGNLDIRLRVAMDDWTPSSTQNLIAKFIDTGNQRSYAFRVHTTGALELLWSNDGSNTRTARTLTPANIVDGTVAWVRTTIVVNNGSGNSVVTFYKSNDGASWTTLATINEVAGSIYDSTTSLVVGARNGGGYEALAGKVYYAELRNGIDGTAVNRMDPNEAAPQTPSSWTSSSGEIWSMQRTAIAQPADIATDLSVGPVEGLPTGGIANYRFIDGVVTYNLPTATSVNSGTNVKLNLGGFTNTAAPSSYTSTIRTYDNASTPAIVDNATTSALTFSSANTTSNAQVAVDPSLTFVIAGRATACNGAIPTLGTSSTGSSISFGRISTVDAAVAAQTFTVSSNAANGWSAYVSSPGPMTAGTKTIAAALGSALSPAAFPGLGTESFGFTTSGRMSFSGPLWSRIDTSNTQTGNTATPTSNVSFCNAYRFQTSPTTAAGNYGTTLVQTVTSNF